MSFKKRTQPCNYWGLCHAEELQKDGFVKGHSDDNIKHIAIKRKQRESNSDSNRGGSGSSDNSCNILRNCYVDKKTK